MSPDAAEWIPAWGGTGFEYEYALRCPLRWLVKCEMGVDSCFRDAFNQKDPSLVSKTGKTRLLQGGWVNEQDGAL